MSLASRRASKSDTVASYVCFKFLVFLFGPNVPDGVAGENRMTDEVPIGTSTHSDYDEASSCSGDPIGTGTGSGAKSSSDIDKVADSPIGTGIGAGVGALSFSLSQQQQRQRQRRFEQTTGVGPDVFRRLLERG